MITLRKPAVAFSVALVLFGAGQATALPLDFGAGRDAAPLFSEARFQPRKTVRRGGGGGAAAALAFGMIAAGVGAAIASSNRREREVVYAPPAYDPSYGYAQQPGGYAPEPYYDPQQAYSPDFAEAPEYIAPSPQYAPAPQYYAPYQHQPRRNGSYWRRKAQDEKTFGAGF